MTLYDMYIPCGFAGTEEDVILETVELPDDAAALERARALSYDDDVRGEWADGLGDVLVCAYSGPGAGLTGEAWLKAVRGEERCPDSQAGPGPGPRARTWTGPRG